MTISTRKERQKEELKDKILQAAKELFMERGYEETSIRNIAEKIEYSPTTIYLYFKDKDDIFYALHQEGFNLLNQYFRSLMLVADPFERLKAMAKAYTTFATENVAFYDLMFIIHAPMIALRKKEEEAWKEGDNAFHFVVDTVIECQGKGYFKNFNPEVFAFTIWSMLHGACSLVIRERCVVVSEENFDNIITKSTAQILEILERMRQTE